MTFRLGSIPVRIHPWFWLTALLLGGNFRDPKVILLWIAVAFVSILVHELGHALAGMAFGLVPQIDLHGMGGTTSWVTGKPLGHGKSIVVSLAGPFAGILIGLGVRLALELGWSPANPYVAQAALLAYSVNVYWGIVNLVPLLPLDGGNVMRSFLHVVTRGRGEKPARVISIVVAVAGLAFALRAREVWLGFLAGLFAVRNYQALRAAAELPAAPTSAEAPEAEPAREQPPAEDAYLALPSDPVRAATEEAYRALEREDGAAAIRAVQPALAPDAPAEAREAGTKILAYALLLEGEWQTLLDVLDRAKNVIGREELERYARTARELGREDDAAAIDRLVAAV